MERGKNGEEGRSIGKGTRGLEAVLGMILLNGIMILILDTFTKKVS